ncbi:MAG: translocation/assembly module TamB domain-containing protein, partial [Bacteroidales bacterium]
GFETLIEDIRIRKSYYAASIRSLQCVINGDLVVNELTAQAEVDERSGVLDDLQIISSAGNIQLNARVEYPSLGLFFSSPEVASLNAELTGRAGSGQAAELLGGLLPLSGYPELALKASVAGSAERLDVEQITMNAGEAVRIGLQGELTGIRGPKFSGSLELEDFTVNRDPLLEYLPDTLIPRGIVIPEYLSVRGGLSASGSELRSDLDLHTPYGILRSSLRAARDSLSKGSDTATRSSTPLNIGSFRAGFSAEEFDAGSLLGNPDTIGTMTFLVQIDGRFSGPGLPEMDLELDLDHFDYMDHGYGPLDLDARYADGTVTGSASLRDEYADMGLSARIRNLDSLPDIQLEMEIEKARMDQMNLASKPTELALSLDMDVRGNSWENLEGDLKISHLRYTPAGSVYALDSMRLSLENIAGRSDFDLGAYNASVGDTMVFDLLSSGMLALSPDSLSTRASLRIRSEQLPGLPEFNLDAKRIRKTEGQEELEFRMEGGQMAVSATASLTGAEETRRMDAGVSIDSFNLDMVYPFLANQLHGLSGDLSGQMTAGGPVSKPGIDGRILFHRTYVNPRILGTGFALEEEEVRVDSGVFRFNRVDVRDDRGNLATINGFMDPFRSDSSVLDLSVMADTFLLLDKSSGSDDPFYGTVYADLDASVSGSMGAPEVLIRASFDRPSDFTFVVPGTSRPASAEGVIEFESAGSDTLDPVPDQVAEEITTVERGMAFTANVNVTDQLSVSVITNPFTGEHMEISGNGDLSFAMDAGGGMSLSGRYEIEEGSYHLILMDVLRREFSIEQGSHLTWNGDLLGATADLSAVYRLNTSAAALLNNPWSGTAQADMGEYGRIPVEVVMNLTGPLLSPGIDFDIRTEDRYRGTAVWSALSRLEQDESELNKQAFSLLLTNQFADPGAGDPDPMSYRMRNTARQTLGNFLSRQLNRFASRHLESVDLSVDVESYEQRGEDIPGARTDVTLGLSREFLDERLTVEVGGRVALEEEMEEGRTVEAGDLTGNFSVEYKLTRDGTYRLRAFNRTDYEDEIEGEVTKTGVSFIFSREFDAFRNLFKRKQEE